MFRFRFYFSANLLKLTSVKKYKNRDNDIMQQVIALFHEKLQILVFFKGDNVVTYGLSTSGPRPSQAIGFSSSSGKANFM